MALVRLFNWTFEYVKAHRRLEFVCIVAYAAFVAYLLLRILDGPSLGF